MSSNCGSSPLAQGTLGSRGRGGNASWLIPARTGSTESTRRASSRASAHPRLCGEYSDKNSSIMAVVGSSPLTRGTRVIRVGCTHLLGLIPARAGNIHASGGGGGGGAAPRGGGGAHSGRTTQNDLQQGSSPLTRGTPCHWWRTRGPCGLIPAREGNMVTPLRMLVGHPAHPRLRGEHYTSCFFAFHEQGSSPLTRGTRSALLQPCRHFRLIPARVGSTE